MAITPSIQLVDLGHSLDIECESHSLPAVLVVNWPPAPKWLRTQDNHAISPDIPHVSYCVRMCDAVLLFRMVSTSQTSSRSSLTNLGGGR